MFYSAPARSYKPNCYFIAPGSAGFIDRDFFLRLRRITQFDANLESS